MMKTNLSGITLWVFTLVTVAVGLVSCQKESGEYYNYQNKELTFAGNTLEYLQSEPGMFDSMVTVLNRIPRLGDSVSHLPITVFAVPNQCFQTVIENLNSLRKSEGKAPLYLSTVDSSQLDTLMCRYLIPGIFPTDSLVFIDGVYMNSLTYGYLMHAQPLRVDASGFVNGGPQKLYYSDPKKSIYVRDWIRTTTQAVDIKTSNGIVHILSVNHGFGFQEFVGRMNH